MLKTLELTQSLSIVLAMGKHALLDTKFTKYSIHEALSLMCIDHMLYTFRTIMAFIPISPSFSHPSNPFIERCLLRNQMGWWKFYLRRKLPFLISVPASLYNFFIVSFDCHCQLVRKQPLTSSLVDPTHLSITPKASLTSVQWSKAC